MELLTHWNKGETFNEMIRLKFEAEETLKWYSLEKKKKIKKLSETTVDKSAETKQVMFLHAKLVKFWNNLNLDSYKIAEIYSRVNIPP